MRFVNTSHAEMKLDCFRYPRRLIALQQSTIRRRYSATKRADDAPRIKSLEFTMKSSPKLLPWLARKAGLTLEKAEALWCENFANESVAIQFGKNPELFYRKVLECFQQASGTPALSAPASARKLPLLLVPSKSKHSDDDIIGSGFAIA